MLEASSSDGKLQSYGKIKRTEDNSVADQETMFRQWHEEITELARAVEGLIQSKVHGMQLTEKLKELDPRQANTECILRQLRQSLQKLIDMLCILHSTTVVMSGILRVMP
ncbi:hypothetical protein FEM48_Zijuj10G0018200 [Ziziphus jujuba var. spinosa]|uniref:Uncharacterized protein n=1 Tax=Ziziphus jujuba var. spinosa TaxID=714518 RepID=A0A978UKK8_ZIZJJ|nr:hypothetical protein FEM48_Zijuj10G0018200 [Ziziphus jujuba var. spinosa]